MDKENHNKILENTFNEVKHLIKTKDKRLKKRKWEISLAKQEFLTIVRENAELWFNQQIKLKK